MAENETLSAQAESQMKQFLESTPPGRRTAVSDLTVKYGSTVLLNLPKIRLHCGSSSCDGIRYFEAQGTFAISPREIGARFVTYQCRDCGESTKVYALWWSVGEHGDSGLAMKYGEHPAFGPPTPSKVISLIGPDREYFLKGRRAENQGLGIAAFAYYRRVIENQKNRIFDEIIRVTEKIGGPDEIIQDLKAAKVEVQFSKAVSVVKHGLPQSLLINGHNPLTLLHSALSEGLHDRTDEECLELATSIRVVLTDFAERLATALNDSAELNAAVNRLLRSNTGTARK